MALSNTLREPRRELTESAVGILITFGLLGGLSWADYRFAVRVYEVTGADANALPIPITMFFTPMILTVVLILIAGLLTATHAIGEGICNVLERNGVRLRPVKRYR